MTTMNFAREVRQMVDQRNRGGTINDDARLTVAEVYTLLDEIDRLQKERDGLQRKLAKSELGAVATINRPVAFPGTAEEAEANYRTHDWIVESPEEPLRCLACDSKEWHVAASYPCGVEPPRETVTI